MKNRKRQGRSNRQGSARRSVSRPAGKPIASSEALRSVVGIGGLQRTIEELQALNEELRRRENELENLRDALEKRIAERTFELRAIERDFRVLADNVPALFAYVDQDECYRYVNRRYTEVFKRPVSQIIGKGVKEILGDRYPALRSNMRRALSGETVRFENELTTPAGTHIFQVQLVPDIAKSKEVQGFFVLAVDITEERQRADALARSENNLRAIVETAAEAIITISSDGSIGSFNPAAERMFGFEATEAIGQSVRILMPSPYNEEHDRYLRRYLRTGEPRIIGATRELTGRRKDGSTFPIELSVSNVDHLGFFTGLIRDVSERKLAEQREHEHQVELAHVLRVATAGELASGLAHELNQPLTAVSNNIQACVSRLRRGQTERKLLLQLLKQASDEALHAGGIVHTIRDLVEKRPPSYERFDLRKPIRRCTVLLAGELQRNGISLQIQGVETPIPVVADMVQIEQVLINLVQNAIDSVGQAGDKEGHLDIRVSRPGKRMVEVAVRDTGAGIAKDVAKQIFNPFFSTKPDGLGVGLALCRRIIEAHGGKLWAEPRRGRRRGATFRFTLLTGGGRRSGAGRDHRMSDVGRSRSESSADDE